MPSFRTVNPATGEILAEYRYHAESEIGAALDAASSAFASWRRVPFARRAELLMALAVRLEAGAERFAALMAHEMGKPVREGAAEIRKCALVCRYYAQHGGTMLAPRPALVPSGEAFAAYEPLGPVLAVMPWNFPFWQVFRCAAPIVMAGNTIVLKHASNVPECAAAIARLFLESGFPDGVLRHILIPGNQVAGVIGDRRIRGVTITGSTAAGKAVGAAAGGAIKPSLLELGGSDAFIVLKDADIEAAANAAVTSRCLNSGQSCIAAKRFIIEAAVHDEFLDRFVAGMRARIMGDPLDPATEIGPQARTDLRDALAGQAVRSVSAGARLLCGGTIPDKSGAWYPPTVLAGVKPGMAAFDEETFGPIGAVVSARDENEAIALANLSEYGLGASLWTRDEARARRLIPEIEAGAAFVNGIVKSDPLLPFGGIKSSGYGRELAAEGIRAFTNLKSVWLASAFY